MYFMYVFTWHDGPFSLFPPTLIVKPGTFSTLPSLRTLRIDIDGSEMKNNLASTLSRNPALMALHLNFVGKGLGSAGGGSGQALRNELQEEPPPRLREIVLEGRSVSNIHPAAFRINAKCEELNSAS